MSVRIVFADDHQLVRETLKQFLIGLENYDKLQVDEAESLPSLLAYSHSSPTPAVILLDLHMPGMNGTESIGVVRTAFPQSRVVILSGYADKGTIMACFNAGADGFIPKKGSRKEFVAALQMVMDGERYVPSMLLDQQDDQTAANTTGTPIDELIGQLSERERKMLILLAEGKKNKEIAHTFTLEEVTIKLALSRLYKKMGASNRAAAVRLAIKAGLV